MQAWGSVAVAGKLGLRIAQEAGKSGRRAGKQTVDRAGGTAGNRKQG